MLKLLVLVLGLALGSFPNVAIYCLPPGEGVVAGRSRCPSCGKPRRFYHLILLLGFLWLRRRCR